jgi:hypothetical protein
MQCVISQWQSRIDRAEAELAETFEFKNKEMRFR